MPRINPPAEGEMPQIKWNEISLGNIASIVATILTVAGGILIASVQYTQAVDTVRRELEKKDLEHGLRISALEAKVIAAEKDHDRIVSMEADVKFIRQILEANKRRQD